MIEMENNNSNISSININNDDNIMASLASSEENPRVKFLCSFGGSILPRPQDGKLRYVGGETRIVSVKRGVYFEELMSRMRDLFDGAAILKYQQPDEDLEALVSVLNDDDVINMMEEYDKLGSGDGFTRLRIFLFSHLEQDLSPRYMDGDERNTERQYVDALNSLNEVMDCRRSQFNDSPVDEVHIGDQFFSSMNPEGSVHSQRNYEMGMLQYNLRQLAIPSIGSGQNSAPFPQWYNDENPFSPAYFSPRCPGSHDARAYSVPTSPSSAYYRRPFQEMPDKFFDRMTDEINHPQVNSLIRPDHPRYYSDKVLWVPAGGLPVDRGGFSGNMINAPHVSDGTSVCDHCKMTFHENPEEQSHLEQLAMRNGFPQVVRRCPECLPNREAVLLNTDLRLLHSDRPLYNDSQTTERGWSGQNQLTQNDESRAYISGIGKMGNRYTLDGIGAAVPVSGGNLPEGSFVPTTCTHIEDSRHIRAGPEWGADIYHGQAMAAGSHHHTPSEERSVHTANMPCYYGPDVPHQVLHGHPSPQAMWRNAPPSVQVPPLYESSNVQPRINIPSGYESSNVQPRIDIPSGVVPRDPVEASGQFFIGVDPSPWAESSHRRLVVDRSVAPEHPYSQISKLNHVAPFQEIQPTFTQDPVRNQHTMLKIPSLAPETLRPSELPPINVLSSSSRGYSPMPREDTDVKLDERGIHGEASESTRLRKVEHSDVDGIHPLEQNFNTDKNGALTALNPIDSKSIRSENRFNDVTQLGEINTCPPKGNSDLTYLPESIASSKKANLESVEVVKTRSQEDGDTGVLQCNSPKIAETDETQSPDVNGNSEGRSQDENSDSGKIEPTKAEEEAIARGLQTIRNDDLEEVRELGSGSYGAVYHGKWKGSDVAIKRIKASCFAGRPSERERLIADFWKEALILSSLHHPNVVSFYGVVRDGPDGSLATVTEFMINGSLKQYLRKKDRTIDRRKRLIIAMDAAFGMGYLHEKNIVHFDLKCENLLVNMRDPHRPVCKIGDLGLSKVKQHTLVSGGVRGTLPWMAPELLSGKSSMVTDKIDVYSFGIVMWELLTGEEPYSEMHCASIIGGIVNTTLRPQIPSWCDPKWKSLMESCWAPDPVERPSFSDISQKLRSMAAAMNVK